jgi:cholesterol transport system auxiliary component
MAADRLGRGVAHMAGLAAVVSLCGCISLFPKEAPVQLYRFGAPSGPPAAQAAPAAPAHTLSIRANVSSFDGASAGDRILTVEGEKTAYVASARWNEPALTLFNGALERSFERHPGPIALLGRNEVAASDARLSLDVETFEARYLQGPASPPTVVVQFRAALDSARSAAPRRERVFRVEQPAASNSVGAIVAAFDTAVTASLDQMLTWLAAGTGA